MLFTSSFSAGSVSYPPADPPEGVDAIRFDAARICAGVTFHLFDDVLVRSVDAASVMRTLRRLVEQNVHAAIARDAWQAMDGRDRLEWLLRNGRTRAVISRDGIAVLTAPPKSLW